MGARWPWIVAGLGLLLTVGMGVVAGLWLAKGGLEMERLIGDMGDDASARRDIARLSRRLGPPQLIEPSKVASISAVFIQDGVLWARPFSANAAKPVMSEPERLGYSRVCCLVGPTEEGKVVGYGYLEDGSGEIFEIGLGTGDFRVLAKQEDSRDSVSYWPAMSGGVTAIWMPEKSSSASRIPVGNIRLLDPAGKVMKELSVLTTRIMSLSADGKSLFAIVPRSRAYVQWHGAQKGPAPEKMGIPEAEMLVKIDVNSERVTEVTAADTYLLSWDERLIWADREDATSFLTPNGKEIEDIHWSENILWTTDLHSRDLILGLHVPWPEDARIARRNCREEYGVISAFEPTTSKVQVLDTICYSQDRGPELSFGPWSGEVKAVKGR